MKKVKNSGPWWLKKTGNGYVFDKRIFNVYAVLFVLGSVLIMNSLGWDFGDRVYLSCPSYTICYNPLYGQSDEWYGTMEYLPPGFEYGEPMPRIVRLWEGFGYLSLIGVFLVNHLVHNRKWTGLKL